MTDKLSSVVSGTSIVFIFILSFRAFAGFLAPDFDADQAVHVLMAYDLQLPEDLYYWGQDRLGSLLPILSHWLLNVLPLTPIEAVSYVQYAFLIVGFLCFTSALRKTTSKVTFALIWFLPPAPFLKLVEVAHPYAPQLALLGIAFAATNRSRILPESNKRAKLVLNLIILASLILSVWVSDLSLVPLMLAIALFAKTFLQHFQLSNQAKSRHQAVLEFLRKNLQYTLISIALLLGVAFLAYAKSTASQREENYGMLAINGLDIIAHIVRSIITTVGGTLLFQAGNPSLSLYAIAVFVLVVILTRYGLQLRQHDANFIEWIPFLLLSAIGTFILILLSRWTFIQETPPRYFIAIYVFCWLSALLIFDNLQRPLIHKAALRRVTALIVLTALLGSLSLPGYVYAIAKPQSRLSMLQPFATLGEAGFIGEYWASYLLCIVAPERLNCTPHDQSFFRCWRCAKAVLASPVIYLVDRDWLETFPDEIEQFGQRLKRQEPAQELAGYRIAPYHIINQSSDE
ncbi:hypothetical protein ACQ4M3_23170 [Leptolyngbya sp. AN03gr2]|uniref:hypothetical protein n=1 Tax=unclassified Leptolyngbya TaxID=2650499 RepID=UPI003D31A82B